MPPLGRSLLTSLAVGLLGPPDFHAPNENAPPEGCGSVAWMHRGGAAWIAAAGEGAIGAAVKPLDLGILRPD